MPLNKRLSASPLRLPAITTVNNMLRRRRELEIMPFDKIFIIDDGNQENCHATGYEVFDGVEWWNEYSNSENGFEYGR